MAHSDSTNIIPFHCSLMSSFFLQSYPSCPSSALLHCAQPPVLSSFDVLREESDSPPPPGIFCKMVCLSFSAVLSEATL